MNYRCKRTCFVGDRLWREGEVYELPENIHKSPKNFMPLDGQPIAEVKAEVKEAVTPAVEAESGFKCKTCNRVFKTRGGLKIHKKSHKK